MTEENCDGNEFTGPVAWITINLICITLVWVVFSKKMIVDPKRGSERSRTVAAISETTGTSNASIQRSKGAKLIVVYGMVTITSYLIACASYLGMAILRSNCQESDKTGSSFANLDAISWLSYLASNFCLLIVFNIRLKSTFAGTIYAISNKFVQYMTIYLLIVCFSHFVTIVIYVVDHSLLYIMIGDTVIVLVSLAICSILLLGLFVNKLKLVIQHFIKQFGNLQLTAPQLHKLNQTIRLIIH